LSQLNCLLFSPAGGARVVATLVLRTSSAGLQGDLDVVRFRKTGVILSMLASECESARSGAGGRQRLTEGFETAQASVSSEFLVRERLRFARYAEELHRLVAQLCNGLITSSIFAAASPRSGVAFAGEYFTIFRHGRNHCTWGEIDG